MRLLSCIIVCVNYSDFLAYTLPLNKKHFDRVLVVTSPTDHDTIRVCEYCDVEYHTTESFYTNKSTFCKGAGINEGLKIQMEDLYKRDWVLHLDADILLPFDFRDELNKQELVMRNLYGVDRLMVNTFDDARELLGEVINSRSATHLHSKFKLGHRVHKNQVGLLPLGFFQLWNENPLRSDKQFRSEYPITSLDASIDDLLFSQQWLKENRKMLPELIVYHLDSENCPIGTNWKGRRTKKFGIPIDSKTDK